MLGVARLDRQAHLVLCRNESGPAMKLNARYVSIGAVDDLYFQVSFKNQDPTADYDPSAPTEPYLLL